MGFAFRLMALVIVFNLAVGMTGYMLGADSMFINKLESGRGTTQADDLRSTMSTAGNVPIEQANFWYRFLDVININFFHKIQDFANSTILSIPTLLVNIGLLPMAFRGWLDSLIILIYTLGIFELFTGRNLFDR